MFPPLLYLVLLFGLLLCFPLGIFPLPVLALKERLDFREQDTGKGLYLVIGNPCPVKAAPRRTGSLETPYRLR